MLEVLFWNFLFGIYLVVIQVPTVESRVGYSSKETSHPVRSKIFELEFFYFLLYNIIPRL